MIDPKPKIDTILKMLAHGEIGLAAAGSEMLAACTNAIGDALDRAAEQQKRDEKAVAGVDTRCRIKLGQYYGDELNGHWFYLHPADEHASRALTAHTGNVPPPPTDTARLIEFAAAMSIALKSEYVELATSQWNNLPEHIQNAIEAEEARIEDGFTQDMIDSEGGSHD